MKVVLKSRITNTSGIKQFFRWAGPHGHYLEPDQQIELDGAYPSMVMSPSHVTGCLYDIENQRASVTLITNLPVQSPGAAVKPSAKPVTAPAVAPAPQPPVAPPKPPAPTEVEQKAADFRTKVSDNMFTLSEKLGGDGSDGTDPTIAERAIQGQIVLTDAYQDPMLSDEEAAGNRTYPLFPDDTSIQAQPAPKAEAPKAEAPKVEAPAKVTRKRSSRKGATTKGKE